jgi:ABC-type phosphate transport system substrate-binding protein
MQGVGGYSSVRRNLGGSTLRRVLLGVIVLSGLLAGQVPVGAESATAYRVIVNNQVKGLRISRGALSSIFLKQAPKWNDGSAILPVDQSVRSAIRRSFSGDVLLQGIPEVQVYWQRRMAQGVTPPPVRATDEEVVAFVASTPGAIGYVSPAVVLPETVKTIELAD